MKNINIHNYYSTLKNLFPQTNYEEGRFLRDFKKSLYEYTISHPYCTYDDLVSYFGKPQDIISEYLTCQNSDYILECIKKKKHTKCILRMFIIFLLVSGIGFSIFCFAAYKEVKKGKIVYGNYDIAIEGEDPYEDEKK